MAIGMKAKREVPIEVLRDGQTVPLTVTPDAQTKYEIGDIGVLPGRSSRRLCSVVAGEAAREGRAQAGRQSFSPSTAQPIAFAAQLIEAIAKHPNQVVVFDVQRGGERRPSR